MTRSGSRPGPFEGEPLSRAAKSRPDLVGDEDDPEFPAARLQFFQEPGGCLVDAAHTLHRLDDQRGGQVAQALQFGKPLIQRFDAAIRLVLFTGIREEVHEAIRRREGIPDPCAMGRRERAQRAPVVSAFEGENPLPFRCVLRGLQRRLHGLRPGIRELEAVEMRRKDLRQTFVEFGAKGRRQPGSRMEDAGIERAPDGGLVCGMRVAQIGGRGTAGEIQIAPAGPVDEPGPLARDEHRRIRNDAKRVRGRALPAPRRLQRLPGRERHSSRSDARSPSSHERINSSPAAGIG